MLQRLSGDSATGAVMDAATERLMQAWQDAQARRQRWIRQLEVPLTPRWFVAMLAVPRRKAEYFRH